MQQWPAIHLFHFSWFSRSFHSSFSNSGHFTIVPSKNHRTAGLAGKFFKKGGRWGGIILGGKTCHSLAHWWRPRNANHSSLIVDGVAPPTRKATPERPQLLPSPLPPLKKSLSLTSPFRELGRRDLIPSQGVFQLNYALPNPHISFSEKKLSFLLPLFGNYSMLIEEQVHRRVDQERTPENTSLPFTAVLLATLHRAQICFCLCG